MHSHPLSFPAFLLFCIMRFCFTAALFVQSVTIGWQVYAVARLGADIRQSAFIVGMIGLAQFTPLFLFSLPAGVAADRYDRRQILAVCFSLQMLCALVFMVLSRQASPSLHALFALAALFGLARAFANPAASALAPALVPAEIMPRAVPWTTLSGQAGMVIGPWIGGSLAAFGPFYAYGAAAMLYTVAIAIVAVLLTMPLNARADHRGASRLTMVREGIAYLRSSPVVLGAISLDLFAVLFGGVTALLPVVSREILHVGADGFGLLRSGAAIGGGTMTLLLSLMPIRRHAGPFMLGAVAIYGLATIAFAFSSWLWLSFALLIVLGGADSISVYVRQSLVQIVTPHDMRGRVSAVSTLFISASNELGEFESGITAGLLGPIGSILFGGIGSLAIVVAWTKIFPALAHADRLLPDAAGGTPSAARQAIAKSLDEETAAEDAATGL